MGRNKPEHCISCDYTGPVRRLRRQLRPTLGEALDRAGRRLHNSNDGRSHPSEDLQRMRKSGGGAIVQIRPTLAYGESPAPAFSFVVGRLACATRRLTNSRHLERRASNARKKIKREKMPPSAHAVSLKRTCVHLCRRPPNLGQTGLLMTVIRRKRCSIPATWTN
jgi:hypothetical protein